MKLWLRNLVGKLWTNVIFKNFARLGEPYTIAMTVAEVVGDASVKGVVLIGPGDCHMTLPRDGARYTAAVKQGLPINRPRQAGARTIAQDEATCVVFGMPKVAIELGDAEEVAPIHHIAQRMLELAHNRRPQGHKATG